MTTITIDITNEKQTTNKSIDRLQESLEKMQRQMDKLFYQKSEIPSDRFSNAMEKTRNLAINISVAKTNQMYDRAKETSGYAQPKQTENFYAQTNQTEAPQRIVQAIDRMAQTIERALAPQVIDGMMNGALNTGKEMFGSIKQGFGKFKEGFSFLNSGIFQKIKEVTPEALVEAANGIGGVLGAPVAGFFGVIGKIGDNFIEAKTKLGTGMQKIGLRVEKIGDILFKSSDSFEWIGGALINGIGALSKGIGFFLSKGISGMISLLGNGINQCMGFFGTALKTTGNILSQNSGILQKGAGLLVKGIGFLTSGMGAFLNITLKEVGNVIGVVGEGFSSLVGFVGGGIKNLTQKITGNLGGIGKAFIGGFGIVASVVKGIFSFIGGAIKAAWTGVQNLIVKPIVNYEGSLSASTGYNQLFKYSDMYSNAFQLASSGDTSQKHTDWSVQGVNNYIEEMKNGDYTPTDPSAAFEDKLNEIGMSGVYSLDSTTGIGMRYVNAGKSINDIERELTAIQNTAAAFNLSEQGYQELAGRVLQIGESESVSLQDITQGFSVPMMSMIVKGLGEATDEAGIERVKQRIKNQELSGRQLMDAFLKGVEQEQDNGGLKGVSEDLSNSTVSGLKTKLSNLFQGNIVKRWARGLTEGLQSGAKKGLVSVGEFINEHKDTFEELGNIAQGIGNSLGEFGLDAIKNTITRMETLFASTEFKEGDLSDKMKQFWDDVIKKPFDDWWQNTGSPLVNGVLDVIGEKMGQGLTGFLSILFGMDEKEALKDGENAGTGFTQGFARGFDGEKVMNAFADMLSKVIEKIWHDIWTKDKEPIEVRKSASNYGDYFDKDGNLLPGVNEEQLVLKEDNIGPMRTGASWYEYSGDKSLIQKNSPNNGMSPEDIAHQQKIFDVKTGQITREVEANFVANDLEAMPFDKAIENYNTLSVEQKRILDEGLQKIQALNEQFAFLGNEKYADVIVRVFYDDQGLTIDSRTGSITIPGIIGRQQEDEDLISYADGVAHAKGGIFSSPHVGLVAEAGPEAIIPLSGANKSNGISLWEQAGYILGTLPKHAEGGIFGEIDEEKNGRSSFLSNNFKEEANNAESVSNITAPIQVNTNITGMNFTFQGAQAGDKEGIMQVIKEQMPTIADEIAGTIAVNIQRIFANMKKGAV